MIDRRLVLANDRVVHHAIAAQFPALKPVASTQYTIAAPVADVLRRPDGPRERQFRYGDIFEVIEHRDGYAFGLGPESFPYAGWIKDSDLTPLPLDPATAGDPVFVISRQTHAYSKPDFKSPERLALPHLAQLDVYEQKGRFSHTNAGWVPSNHLSNTAASDPVTVAELYLGVPYLWGGNSIWGIDCSGLVTAGLIACGIPCHGDSDLQQTDFPAAPDATYQRGDLLFWKGHVAWVADAHTLLHANAHHMAVAYEPIQDAIARIQSQGDGPVTKHARLTKGPSPVFSGSQIPSG